jgi:hypothetical protein
LAAPQISTQDIPSPSPLTADSRNLSPFSAHAQQEICAQYSRLSALASHSDARVRRALLRTVQQLIRATEQLIRTEAGLTATLNSLVVLSLDEVPTIQVELGQKYHFREGLISANFRFSSSILHLQEPFFVIFFSHKITTANTSFSNFHKN